MEQFTRYELTTIRYILDQRAVPGSFLAQLSAKIQQMLNEPSEVTEPLVVHIPEEKAQALAEDIERILDEELVKPGLSEQQWNEDCGRNWMDRMFGQLKEGKSASHPSDESD